MHMVHVKWERKKKEDVMVIIKKKILCISMDLFYVCIHVHMNRQAHIYIYYR